MSEKDQTHRSGLSPADYNKLTGFEGDWRDTWWDDDFLALMARKWGLDSAQTALDVGCGVGHWGQRLMHHMSASATMVGIDAEAAWMARAGARAAERGLGERTRYQVAQAQCLPWADGSFDMVTCQTLLMHVPNPQEVVREMVRVLRAGGLFVAVEPNNFGTTAGELMSGSRLTWPEASALLELEYICALGKEALGEGFYSIGEQLPALLQGIGWSDIHVHQNNQCAARIPPYSDLNARTGIQMMRDSHAAGALMVEGGTPENVQRYFLAGGGDPARLSTLCDQVRAREASLLAAIDAGTLCSAGGHIHHLVWGHKPL
jgi:2-polyprenyl-3-methyl-5-hydroxy-6-metoxy-1,4-benzoquinol methylase